MPVQGSVVDRELQRLVAGDQIVAARICVAGFSSSRRAAARLAAARCRRRMLAKNSLISFGMFVDCGNGPTTLKNQAPGRRAGWRRACGRCGAGGRGGVIPSRCCGEPRSSEPAVCFGAGWLLVDGVGHESVGFAATERDDCNRDKQHDLRR